MKFSILSVKSEFDNTNIWVIGGSVSFIVFMFPFLILVQPATCMNQGEEKSKREA